MVNPASSVLMSLTTNPIFIMRSFLFLELWLYQNATPPMAEGYRFFVLGRGQCGQDRLNSGSKSLGDVVEGLAVRITRPFVHEKLLEFDRDCDTRIWEVRIYPSGPVAPFELDVLAYVEVSAGEVVRP